MKKFLIPAVLLLAILSFKLIPADTAPLWLRYPAISPDGKTIAFCYKGDIYRVDAKGGTATTLTLSDGSDAMPVWSPDGKWIAFASDRNGNFDVYLVPAEGGAARRLTWHSSNDMPHSFTPDGSAVLFTSGRMDHVNNIAFPSGALPELYSVPVKGGREVQVLSTPAEDARWDKAGARLIFHDKKGGEDVWRKHHVSSIARDLWMYTAKDNKFTKLTDFPGEDRNPVWSPDESEVYYLSEKSGTFNVWKFAAAAPAQATQVTKFDKNPVRFLSMASDGTLCFSYNGELYTKGSGEPQKLAIRIATDERYTETRTETFTTGATEMSISPSGKEVVFVVRGEVFVATTEGKFTRRITNTPGQERSVSFSPDGRSILYASERNKIWGVYQTSLTRKEEKMFFNSTVLKEEPIVVGKTEAFQPRYSPDGAEVAYLEDRTAINVINLKTKAIRNILPADKSYSYSDGDQWFDWSPDGKYLLFQFLVDGNWMTQVGLSEAAGGGKIINLTESGFDHSTPKWAYGGKVMTWFSNRHGMKNVASHGAQADVYGLWFTQAGWDRFKMSKEDFALIKDKEEKEKMRDREKSKGQDSIKKPAEPVKIDMEGLSDRKARLTLHSSDLGDAILSADGEQLYYLCRFEKGYDLWVNKLREQETKLLVRLDAKNAFGLEMDREGKQLFLVADGNIVKVNLEKTEKKEVSFNAEMVLNTAAEREEMFEHQWRQVKKKFYVTDLQKTDWDYYKENYARFLPHINNNRDFAEMMSELLGELNASHTGCRYFPKHKNPDETASLGVFFDESYKGAGMKVAEVIDKSPLIQAGTQVKAGIILEKIDGVEITAETNIYPLLNRKAGKYTLLSFYDESSKKRWDESMKPASPGELNELLYKRWIKRQQQLTDKLSNGQLGYMHVRGMNDESYRAFYEQVMGKYINRKALIVDTRFNGGGWLHDDLATFLSGKKYIDFIPRERKIGVEPQSKWIKPSVVLMSEGNYSDAHMFPVIYKTLGIGKLVGMPVPGTGTAVWWETLQDNQLVFGIPQVGIMNMEGKYYENNQLEPDFKVMNEFNIVVTGRDQQLEKAVDVLMGK